MVDGLRENKAEDGFRTLLAELYPDNAHFIYELLQNAEDARAKDVFFDLGKSRLIFTHDGERAFDLENVEAITGIGQSPKKDDETQIGKFGVGFKAVYSYTNHPEVRSGRYAFRIDDLFVPEPIDAASPGDKTIFTFPFDRKEKRREVAFDEVARGLRELGPTTVLFLSSIRSIRYKLADGEAGRIVRSDDTAPYISIRHTVDGETDETHWLKLVGDHTLSSQIPRGQTVAAAFKLDGPLNRRIRAKGTARAHVVPMAAGEAQTCIYFPAAKETSGLRFHIHAPFASTVARDSVRQSPENDELVDAIGCLVASELPALRDDGLIDDGLLGSLPNARDVLQAPYTAIRDHVRDAFWNEDITPVLADAAFGGTSFAPAKSLVSSPPEFRSGIEARDLPMLLSLADIAVDGTPRWIAPRESRAGQLLGGLGVANFGWAEIKTVLEAAKGGTRYELAPSFRVVHDDPPPEWDRWLMSKDDERLRVFYELLGRGVFEDDLDETAIAGVDLIRVRTKTRRIHLDGAEVFLPASRDELGEGSRVPIALAYLGANAPDKSVAYLEAFYKAAGVRHWNIRSQVQVRLDAYEGKNAESVTDAQHLVDIRMFIAHLAEHPEDKSLFKSRHFLQAKPRDGVQEEWLSPEQIVIDKPYLPTGLSTISDYSLSTVYRGRKIEGITDFAVEVGCVTALAVSRANAWSNPQYQHVWNPYGKRWTAQGTKRDFDVPELEQILESKNRDLLRLLWEMVVGLQTSYENAVFQLNAGEQAHYMKSQLFQRLADTSWILDKRGHLKKPRAMSIELLPEGWSEPTSASFVMRLGFGEEARIKSAQEEAERELLRRMGAPADLLDEILEAPKEEREQFFRDFAARQRQKRAFPQNASADPVRRAALVGADAGTAPDYKTEIRERTVVIGAGEASTASRQYLREMYSTDGGDMFCQLCQLPMPFKLKDGTWYFEAVQLVRERKKVHHQNALALCPLCAARYKYVRETSDADILTGLDALVIVSETGTAHVPVLIGGARMEVRFTGKHATDLKAVLAAAGDAR